MITKTTMVLLFDLQNSHLLTLSLPTEEVFQVNGHNQPVANTEPCKCHTCVRTESYMCAYSIILVCVQHFFSLARLFFRWRDAFLLARLFSYWRDFFL